MSENGDFKHKEVVEAVEKEIKSLGENTKKNYDELRSQYEDLKRLVDKNEKENDSLIKEQIEKISTDITVRQEKLDEEIAKKTTEINEKIDNTLKDVDSKNEELQKRFDEIEVAMKRAGNGEDELSQKEAKELREEAIAFEKDIMTTTDISGNGVTSGKMKKLLKDGVSIEKYTSYKESFNNFIRTHPQSLTADDLKSLQVGIDPDGGYTVTPAMSNTIIKRLFETDPLRQLASVETISTGAIEWLVDWDEADFGWEGETETGAETNTPTLNKKRIPVHVMYAKPRATQTLLEDSGINVENWLATKVSDRFIRGEAAAFVEGDGIGKPTGFLSYADGTNYGQIERTNMGAAATLTADGFINVKYSLIEQYLNRGTWLMNRLTVADAMQLKDGIGNYIWKPGLAEERHGTILGLPVRMSTTMPQVAAGALSVAIADWREAYMIVDRLGITVQRDPFTVKPFIEFYTRKRVGGDVTNFQAIKIGTIAA